MIKIRCDDNWQDLINEQHLQEILISFIKHLFDNDYELSLYITDNTEIKKLNKRYRKENYPTDILSWSYTGNFPEIKENTFIESKNSLPSGELVVSAERVLKQSEENGWDFETELIRLLAHGCAHLSGLDHDSSIDEDVKMMELEITLLKNVGLLNIY